MYDSWFFEENGSIIPSEWIKAGSWSISNNVIAGDDTISFYAINTKESEILSLNLKQFSSQLPETVLQSGKYLK